MSKGKKGGGGEVCRCAFVSCSVIGLVCSNDSPSSAAAAPSTSFPPPSAAAAVRADRKSVAVAAPSTSFPPPFAQLEVAGKNSCPRQIVFETTAEAAQLSRYYLAALVVPSILRLPHFPTILVGLA